MFHRDFEVFLQFSTEHAQRVLHAGRVIDSGTGPFFVAEFQNEDIAPEPGDQVRIFFNEGREFMQQCAAVVPLPDDFEPAESNTDAADVPAATSSAAMHWGETTSPPVGLQPIGRPVSAENRQSYRVSTVLNDISMTFGDTRTCKVLDLSATGFSVLDTRPHDIGSQVHASLVHHGTTYGGTALVQSVKELPCGGFRIGSHAATELGNRQSLENGVRTLSMDVQREQIRRQRRAA